MKSREEWLQERRGCLGGSDCAAVLGEDPFRGPFGVYASKVFGETQDDKDSLMYGRLIEKPIGQMYKHKTGREITDYGATTIQYHADLPWLGVTLDGVTAGSDATPAPEEYQGSGPLEIKNSGGFMFQNGQWRRANPDEWAANPPVHNQIQLQTQIACLGARWGSLTAMFPGAKLVWTDQKRNDLFINAMIPKLEEFWDRVKHRDPPGVDELPASLDIVKKIYNEENGECVVLSERQSRLVRDWRYARDQGLRYKKRAAILEAQVRWDMEDNTFGQMENGKFVTLKKTHRKGYTKVVTSTEFRTLRIANKI